SLSSDLHADARGAEEVSRVVLESDCRLLLFHQIQRTVRIEQPSAECLCAQDCQGAKNSAALLPTAALLPRPPFPPPRSRWAAAPPIEIGPWRAFAPRLSSSRTRRRRRWHRHPS